MTYRDDTRSRRHGGNQVVRRNKAVSRRYDFQFHALAFFHGLPGRVLQWELSLGGDDLVARLPRQAMCPRPRRQCLRRWSVRFLRVWRQLFSIGKPEFGLAPRTKRSRLCDGETAWLRARLAPRAEKRAASLRVLRCSSTLRLQSRTTPSASRSQRFDLWPCSLLRAFRFHTRWYNSGANFGERNISWRVIHSQFPLQAHVTANSRTDCSRLPDGVDQFPYSREMMIVVFGDKIQMVYESHRRLQTRVGNGPGK